MEEGRIARLDGMDWKFDGHAWMETTTTNIIDPSQLLSLFMGHLRCYNPKRRHISESENTMIYTRLDPLLRYSLLGNHQSLLRGVSLYISSVRLLHRVWSFAFVECIMLCPRIL